MSSMLVGYFSYDVIRYLEKIPDNCKDDLKIPDVRLSRPKNLVIYDNLKKKIFYIVNVFYDENINNYSKKYLEIKSELSNLLVQSSKRIVSGLDIKALPMAHICCSPPDV